MTEQSVTLKWNEQEWQQQRKNQFSINRDVSFVSDSISSIFRNIFFSSSTSKRSLDTGPVELPQIIDEMRCGCARVKGLINLNDFVVGSFAFGLWASEHILYWLG